MTRSYCESTIRLRNLYEAIARGDDILQYFPNGLREDLEGREKIAIAEIADRDSIAACLKVIMDGKIKEILPVADDIPPEYGNLNKAFNHVFWLQKQAEKYNAKVYDLVFIKSEEIYTTLTARYTEELISRYGFYAPCISCHMYFHTLRVPIVRALGGTKIVGGERELHDNRVKTSQIPLAIDYYQKAVSMLGGELILPLRKISDTKDIINLTFDDNPQLSCMFKERYGDLPRSVMNDKVKLKKFIEEFSLPITVDLIRTITTKQNVSITGWADDFVEKNLKWTKGSRDNNIVK